jgi:uncharacterized protein (DUF4415 family)
VNKTSSSQRSETNWARVDAMSDKDIDLSDAPEITPEAFARAIVRKGLKPSARKAQITLRVDSEVLEWFRAQGMGYQSQMNAVLRAYKEAQEKA